MIVKTKNSKGEGKGKDKDKDKDKDSWSWKGKGGGSWYDSSPAPQLALPDATPPGVDATMLERLKTKVAGGKMSSYDISQWYIMEFLTHITDPEEMKNICDQLLTACSHLGLP